MSTLILSLLLLFLITVGLLMGKKVAERFENPPSQTITVSPAMKNMMTSGQAPAAANTQTAFEREQDLQRVTPGEAPKLIGPDGEEHLLRPDTKPRPNPEPAPAGCLACPVCPDMSKYIRLDEVPCWNCTLP